MKLVSERFFDDYCFVGEAGASVPGRLGLFSDGDHEAEDVARGKIDDFGDGFGVESDHGAGVVTHVVGGEHERHAGEARGADGFVADELILSFVEWLNHGTEDVLHGLRCVGPVGGWIGEVRRNVGTHDEERTGLFDVRLVPSGGADLFLTLFVANHHQSIILHVEGRRGQLGQTDELGEVCLGHHVVGVEVFDGATALDGFFGGHKQGG